MKISGLDFLEDMEKRLRAWINMRSDLPELACRRFLNFRERTSILKIGYMSMTREVEITGEIACRLVEEPQDFYFRGVYKSLVGIHQYPFTLRPAKNYENDFYNLIDAVGMGWLEALPAPSPEDATASTEEFSPQDLIDQALFSSSADIPKESDTGFNPQDLIDQVLAESSKDTPMQSGRELTPQELIDQALAGG